MGREDLDEAIRTQLNTAIARIEAIEQRFGKAITGTDAEREAIQRAVEAVLTLRDQLRNELMALLDDTEFAR